MKRLLLLFLFLLFSVPSYSTEVIESFDNKNIAVLNDELRNFSTKIRSLEGGGIEQFEDATADSVLIGNGSVFVGRVLPSCSGATSKLLYNSTTDTFSCGTEGTESVNVIFSWSGSEFITNTSGVHVSASLTPNFGTAPVSLLVGAYGSTARTVLNFKYKHISGITTIAIHARMWASAASNNAYCTVTIGAATATALRALTATPGWATAANIDVSGLTPGQVYEGIVQLKSDDDSHSAICSAITLIAD